MSYSRRKTPIVVTIMTAALLLCLCCTATASPAVMAVAVDGRFLDLPRAAHVNGGVMFVPARAILEAAGVGVAFGADGTLLSAADSDILICRQGNISVDGEEITVAASYDSGMLFIPIRAVGEALGLTIKWLGSERVLHVVSREEARQTLPSRSGVDPSRTEITLMARMVEAEAFGEVYEGKVAVAAVILNRVEHRGFPETIEQVIMQPGQFATRSHLFAATPREVAIRAVMDAINGWDPTGGALYFFNPRRTSNQFLHSRADTVDIGNHRFAR